MDNNTDIRLSMREYAILARAKTMLEALEAAGVDNWDGYDYAVNMAEGRDAEDYGDKRD